jgi:ferritin-like metal-binding protein YciE
MFIEEVRDMYDAEQRLTKALPKLAEESTTPELKAAFESHLGETETHITRLEQIFGMFDRKAQTDTCKGMKGIISEGEDILDEDTDPWIKDAAIIAAAQKAEHYEIAAYGTLRAWARILGRQDVEQLVEFTLEEEKKADEKLNGIASRLNARAASVRG